MRFPFDLEGRYDVSARRTVALTYDRRGNNFDQCVSRDITTRDITTRDDAITKLSGAAAFPIGQFFAC